MTPEIFETTLRELVRQAPLRPILVELFSGDRLLLGHPAMLRADGNVLVYQGPDSRHRVFECDAVCPLLDVLST